MAVYIIKIFDVMMQLKFNDDPLYIVVDSKVGVVKLLGITQTKD